MKDASVTPMASPGRRAAAYWFADGLPDIALGTTLLVFGSAGLREFPSRGSMLGVRDGLEFPEDSLVLEPDDPFALFTDGLTEARDPSRALFGTARLVEALSSAPRASAGTALENAWQAVTDFRDGTSATDDATLLLGRVVAIENRGEQPIE